MTRTGRPDGALVNVTEYEQLKVTIDVLNNEGLIRQIHTRQGFFAACKNGLSVEMVFGARYATQAFATLAGEPTLGSDLQSETAGLRRHRVVRF